MRAIYLAWSRTAARAALARLSGARASGTIGWVYLGRDSDRAAGWEAVLDARFAPVVYGPLLQQRAIDWRDAYIEWTGELGTRHDGLSWWTSAIAERNTMGPSLYHSMCYLRVLLDLARTAEGPLLVVVESAALLQSLAEHPELRSRVRRLDHGTGMRATAWWVALFLYRWTAYVLDAALAQLDARLTRDRAAAITADPGRPRVLLHTCLDDSYFGEDGPRDRYFPGLAPALRRRGFEVVVLPWLYSVQRTRRAAFRWFRARRGEYLLAEDYYRLRDYAWAAGVVWRQVWMPPTPIVFEGLDVSRLVREARRDQAADPSAARFVRYYRLVERLARGRVRVDVFIDMFENMACEKPPLLAFRRWMPQVLTIGYQHYLAMFPLLLKLYRGRSEAQVRPVPDVIVACSTLGVEQLVAAGFPPETIRLGPSLRYQHLLRTPARDPEGGGILVIVPLESSVAREMLRKVLAAFSNLPTPEVWLKKHPMMSRETLDRCLDDGPLPAHVAVIEGELAEWIQRTRCAVATASSASLELALQGIPVVTLSRETDFDFDPLSWFPDMPRPVSDSAALRERVLAELSAPPVHGQRLREWARANLAYAVEPVTDTSLDAFVGAPRASQHATA